MRRRPWRAISHATGADVTTEQFSGMKISRKGQGLRPVISIVALIIFSILPCCWWAASLTAQASPSARPSYTETPLPPLVIGGFCALIVTFILYLPRKILSPLRNFTDGITGSVKSMVPAFIILTGFGPSAPSARNYLMTGEYVSNRSSRAPFLSSCSLPSSSWWPVSWAFSMGTLLGTFWHSHSHCRSHLFGLLPGADVITLAATPAGAVYAMPLPPSSTPPFSPPPAPAGDHMAHVSTQLPLRLCRSRLLSC